MLKSAQAAFLLAMLFALLLSMAACSTLPEPGSPPTLNSPVQTPIPTIMQVTVTLQPTRALKPSPTGIEFATPEPVDLAPIPGSTPAGAGAIVHVMPPFFTHDFLVENSWYKDTMNGTIRTFVHTGNVPSPGGFATQQGVVVVQVLKMDAHGTVSMVYYKQFLTPAQSGPVHITGAVGERLILQSTNGTTFYFDAPARQFVPSLTWVSPISTPGAQPAKPSP